MAEELRIRVIFETGEAKKGAETLAKASQTATDSIEGMRRKVQDLEKAFMSAKNGTEAQIKAYQDYQTAMLRLNAMQLKLNSSIANSTRSSASMTMALQSMNFTIRDSPYFFRSFSLGVLAVGNNLNPLIDNLIRVRNEARLVNSTLSKELLKSMKGVNGVIVAFSILVTVIQAVTFAMEGQSEATKELNKDYDEMISKLEKMSKGMLTAELKKQKAELDGLLEKQKAWNDEENKRFLQQSKKGQVYLRADFPKKAEIEQREKVIKKLTEELAVLGDIEDLERRIAENRHRQARVKDDPERSRALEKEIKSDQEKIKALRGIVTHKQKSYITTEAELRKELRILEVLKAQSQSVYDRLQYSKQIADINYKLSEASRLPVIDLDYRAGQFTDRGDTPEVHGQKIDMTEINARRKQEKVRMKADAEDIKDTMAMTDQIATSLGNSLFQAFLQGKLSADEFLKSLLAVVGQLVLIEGLKYIFSGGISGMFGAGLSRGGIVGFSAGGVNWGNSTASHDNALTMLAPQETVLNRRQTLSLFNAIKSGDFSGISGGRQLDVRLGGNVRVDKNSFVYELEKAKVGYNRTKVIGGANN